MAGENVATDANRELPKGHVVGARFVVEHLVARGGMGAVYAACDRQSGGERVALKVMQGRGDAALSLDRFEAESQLLARLRHPTIVRYVAHGVCGGAPYLAMEWLAGESLADRLRRGPLALEAALALATQLAEALAFAHALGVVHRDVKPANVIVEGEGEGIRARLLDFGIARGGHARRFVTGTGTIIGTPGYMAPEQARGAPDLDARVDLFAFGCVLFECLAGFAAFRGATPLALLGKLLLEEAPPLTQAAKNTPPAVAELVARLLAKDRALRPRDGTALLGELEGLPREAGAPIAAPVERLTHREQRFVSVIVAGEVGPSEVASDPGLAATLSTGAVQHRHELKQTIAPFGARVEWTSRGGLLVLLAGSEGAKEQTFFAARCALALRGVLPQTPLALVAGRGEVGAARVVGEVIDRAVGLLATAPAAPGQGAPIVLDEVTATLLGDRFLVAPYAHGHALVGEAALDAVDALGTPRTLLGKPAPFVGRDRELAALRALYEEVAEERVARAALIVGPAGVGKSRLLQELVRELPRRERPPELWLARADPLAASATFGLVAQALRRAASLAAHEPAASARQKLLARAERHLPPADVWRVAALLGEAIGVPFPDDDSLLLSAARQDRHLLAEQVQNAWVDFVQAETAQGPIVLVLEDVHWADPTSLRLVDLALGILAERPFLVLASARPEIRTTSPELWANRSLQELRLPELTRRASEKLVEGALGAALAPEAIARLVEHAAGNAFFLEELIRAAAEGRLNGLPESVLSVVQLRLEALPPDARQLLRAASIFGETFPRDGLERLVSRGGPDPIEALLSLLVDRELLVRRPDPSELVFRHALVREAAYAMLTDDDRRLGHRLAAEWLEATGAGEPFVLAEHFERGDDPGRAVPWYLKGSQQACWNDLRAVLHAASRGAACGAGGEALGELRLNEADALHVLGDLEGAKSCVEAALALFPAGGTLWCAGKGLLLQLLVQLGHVEGAASHAHELLATEPPPAAYHEYERAMLTNVQVYCYCGMPRMAERFLARYDEMRGSRDRTPAADQASRVRDVFLARQNVLNRDVIAALLLDGDLWRAEAAATTALARYFEAGSQLTATVMMTSALLLSAFATGNLEEALTWLEPTLKRVRARGLGIFTVLLGAMRGRTLVRLGRATEARPELDGLRAASRPLKRGYIGLGALTELAQMELALLEYEGAKATTHRVLAQARGARFRSPALAVLAHVALAAGEPDEALVAAREAVELWRTEGAAGYEEPFLWASLHEALVANHHPEEARTLANEGAIRCRAVASLAPDDAAARAFLAGPDVQRLVVAAT